MVAELRKNTEAFVRATLEGESTGHDWWHASRVRANARHIHQVEGGNWQVIELAALLHDVGDRKVIGKEDDDPSIAEHFLQEQKVDVFVIDAVLHVIKNMSYSKSLERDKSEDSIELQIVQDADRLDAIGAIGIARAFAFGGQRGRPLYDPTYESQVFTTSKDYKQAQSSTLHHFDEKLFLLKDLLNTPTARSIAEKRDAFMRTFKEEFLAEWNGEA